MEQLTLDESLFTEIEDLFEEEAPCENANHNDDPHHGGPGEWYIVSKPCSHCEYNRGVRLVCDSFAQYLLHGGPIACGRCKNLLGRGAEAYKSITKKN